MGSVGTSSAGMDRDSEPQRTEWSGGDGSTLGIRHLLENTPPQYPSDSRWFLKSLVITQACRHIEYQTRRERNSEHSATTPLCRSKPRGLFHEGYFERTSRGGQTDPMLNRERDAGHPSPLAPGSCMAP